MTKALKAVHHLHILKCRLHHQTISFLICPVCEKLFRCRVCIELISIGVFFKRNIMNRSDYEIKRIFLCQFLIILFQIRSESQFYPDPDIQSFFIFFLKFLHLCEISIYIKDTFLTPFQIIFVKMIRKTNGFQTFTNCFLRHIARTGL